MACRANPEAQRRKARFLPGQARESTNLSHNACLHSDSVRPWRCKSAPPRPRVAGWGSDVHFLLRTPTSDAKAPQVFRVCALGSLRDMAVIGAVTRRAMRYLGASALLLLLLQGADAFSVNGVSRRAGSWTRRRSVVLSASLDNAGAPVKRTPVPGKSYLKSKPIAIGSATPEDVVHNSDLETLVETSDEWIRTRTGISSRRILSKGAKIQNLASLAASRALAGSGLQPEDIDIVIVATSSPDDLFGDATSVAASLGASKAVAYDLTAACSGFLFATITASQFLHTGTFKHAIVVGADALSRWVDWTDRNTCILFGDGAGAMVLTATETTEDSGLLGFAMHSDGTGHDDLYLPFDQSKHDEPNPSVKEGVTPTKGRYVNMRMNGKEVYKFATRKVPMVIEEALENAGIGVEQVDWLLLHQANIRIMDIVAERLGLPAEKILTNLKDYGNTSAGSIPLALDEAVKAGKVKKGDIIACAGFGAGLSWGSAIIKWQG